MNLNLCFEHTTSNWYELSKCVMDQIDRNLCSPTAVELVCGGKKTTKSLSDYIFGGLNLRHKIAVRVGGCLERGIMDFVARRFGDLRREVTEHIRLNTGNTIQLDVAFYNGGYIYIAELKSNLELDTEKSSKLLEKLHTINSTVDCPHKVLLVSLTQDCTDNITNLKPVLDMHKEKYVVGYSEFFRTIGIDVNKHMWEELLGQIRGRIKEAYDGRNVGI